MNANEYQEKIKEFRVYPEAGTGSFLEMVYLQMGLASEAGEVLGKFKKLIRDGQFSEEAFAAELGDVAWYLANIANVLNIPFEELLEQNYLKLANRKATNTLKGNGDERGSSVAAEPAIILEA